MSSKDKNDVLPPDIGVEEFKEPTRFQLFVHLVIGFPFFIFRQILGAVCDVLRIQTGDRIPDEKVGRWTDKSDFEPPESENFFEDEEVPTRFQVAMHLITGFPYFIYQKVMGAVCDVLGIQTGDSIPDEKVGRWSAKSELDLMETETDLEDLEVPTRFQVAMHLITGFPYFIYQKVKGAVCDVLQIQTGDSIPDEKVAGWSAKSELDPMETEIGLEDLEVPSRFQVAMHLITEFPYFVYQKAMGAVFDVLQIQTGEAIPDEEVGPFWQRLWLLGFVFVFVVGGLGFVGFMAFPSGDNQQLPEGAKTAIEGAEIATPKLTVASVISVPDLIDRDYALRESTPKYQAEWYSILNQRIEIANQIYERPNVDAKSRLRADEILLEALTAMVVLENEHDMSSKDSLARLLDLTKQKQSSIDPLLAARASLGMSAAYFGQFVNNSNESNWQKLQEAVLDTITRFDKCSAEALPVKGSDPWLDLASLCDSIWKLQYPAKKQLLTKLALKLKRCQQERLRTVGSRAYDVGVYSELDYPLVFEGITYGDPRLVRRAEDFVEKASSDPETSSSVFQRCLDIVQRFSQFDMENETKNGITRLKGLPALVADDSLRKQFEKELNDYDTRAHLVGKKFSLAAQSLNDGPLATSKFAGQPVVVVYFSGNHRSLNTIAIAKEVANSMRNKFKVVCCPLHSAIDMGNVDFDSPAMRSVDMVEYAGGVELRSQCPVSSGPYVLILNSNQVVENVNVHEEQIRKRIQSLLKTNSDP